MSKWVKILNIVLVILVVSAAGFLFYKNRTKTPEETINVNIDQNETENKIEEVVIPKLDEATKLKIDLQQLASNFVERYGSYSNQSNYENITDLKPFMTQLMQKSADNFVAAKIKEPNETYFGVFTRALSSEISSINSDQAIVMVNCQKQESTGSASNSKIYYQEAQISFSKENGTWKVAKIEWYANF